MKNIGNNMKDTGKAKTENGYNATRTATETTTNNTNNGLTKDMWTWIIVAIIAIVIIALIWYYASRNNH